MVMRFGVLVLGLGVVSGFTRLSAQDCPALTELWPSGSVSSTLGSPNCTLSNGNPYAPYRLDLPVRGRIQLDLTGDAGLLLILRDASGARVDSGIGIHRAIEAGNYTLLVSAGAPSQPASYSIQSTFTPEPGMLCSGFPNIGLNQTVAAPFPSSGCAAPDGSGYEAYTLSTFGSGTLTVAVTSSDFPPTVWVRGSDGSAVSVAGGTVNAVLSADSEYELVVASGGGTGNYQIATSFIPADAETCRATKGITDSLTDTGTITNTSCFDTIEGSGDQSFYNYYNLAVAAPGMVALSAYSGDFTATLYLLDAAGNVLAVDAGGGGYDQTLAVTSGIRMPLAPGNYTVQLFSDVPSGGNYSFQYAFTPGLPQPCNATAMSPGDAPTGQIALTSCLTALGWGDVYRLTLPAAGTLNLDLASTDFSTLVAIRDAQDNLVASNTELDGVAVAHLTATLPAGAYSVVAAASEGGGHYQLTSQFALQAIPACTYVQALDINGGYIQRLGSGSCIGTNGQPVDYYQFTLPADGVVAAVMTSSEVNGFLTLLDSSGNVLRWDDNGYTDNDPLIVQFLPAGTYQLAARDSGSTVGGLYEVDLRTVVGPRPPFCTPLAAVPVGNTVTGTIGFSGCQYGGTNFADIYQIQLTADTTVDLRLNSSDFDAYLVILDAKGNLVDQDDDSGGNTNARITELLPAGTYYVVAEPYGDYTAHGNYSLIVGQQ